MTGSWRHVAPLFLAMAVGACTVNTTTGSPFPPVPPPVAEVRPLPPVSPDPVIWQPGHWDWNGQAYAWTPGLWVPREGHGSLWQDGYWTQVNGNIVWVPPHWM